MFHCRVAECLIEDLNGDEKITGLHYKTVLMNVRYILGLWNLMRKVEKAAAYHEKFKEVEEKT